MPLNNEIPIDDLSDQVQEIVTDVPHWLIRWGIALFFLILLLFAVFASIISMPSVIKAKVVLETEVPSEEIIVGTSGKLVRLFVNENSVVDSGDVLGFIQSTANHNDVLKLSTEIDTIVSLFSHGTPPAFITNDFKNFRHLGELQSGYQEFLQELIGFKAFLSNGLYEKKIQSINNEISNIEKQNKQLQYQLDLQENNLQLSEKDFEAYKELYQKKVISAEEYRASESKLINSQLPMQNTRASISSNSSLLTQKQTEMMDIENQIYERKSSFLSKVNRFKSELDQWKRNYILQSNSNGRVVFNNRVYLGQWVEENKPVLYIEKEDIRHFFGRLQLGQYSLGKVKKGQVVLLKVGAYPYAEFGLLKGKIDYIPDITFADSLYIAKVTLTNGNITTYNKQIKLKNGLLADAEVVTEKRSLLSKLFNNIYSLFKNRA